jgi:hypothetical protein
VKRGGSDGDDLRQFDILIHNLGDQIAAIDKELVTRRRERPAIPSSGRRGKASIPAGLRRHNPGVIQANPKPHCRAKSLPAGVRGPS